MQKNITHALLPLFLILFLDTLGSSILIPMLPSLFIDSDTSILSSYATTDTRNLYYGFTLGIYSLFMFFGAPILGDLSDKLGRKKVLLVCLGGTAIGYLLSVAAVILSMPWLLILGRCIDGFTAGSMSTAQAAIVDISSRNNKATNMGMILLAVSLGYTVGPLSAGLFTSDLVSWFDLTTPFYFAAFLAIFNACYLWFAFYETHERKPIGRLNWFAGLKVFISAFMDKSIRRLSIVFLLLQLGWATYFQFMGLFLVEQYDFSAQRIAYFMALMGVGFCLSFTVILRLAIKYFSTHTIAKYGISALAIFILVIVLIPHESMIWIFSIPAAAGLSLSYSVVVTLFSNQVDAEKQGWIMGLTAAIGAFAFGFSGLFVGEAANITVAMPIWIAFFCLALSAAFVFSFQPKAID